MRRRVRDIDAGIPTSIPFSIIALCGIPPDDTMATNDAYFDGCRAVLSYYLSLDPVTISHRRVAFNGPPKNIFSRTRECHVPSLPFSPSLKRTHFPIFGHNGSTSPTWTFCLVHALISLSVGLYLDLSRRQSFLQLRVKN